MSWKISSQLPDLGLLIACIKIVINSEKDKQLSVFAN
jgi:hypothetical protein